MMEEEDRLKSVIACHVGPPDTVGRKFPNDARGRRRRFLDLAFYHYGHLDIGRRCRNQASRTQYQVQNMPSFALSLQRVFKDARDEDNTPPDCNFNPLEYRAQNARNARPPHSHESSHYVSYSGGQAAEPSYQLTRQHQKYRSL